MTAILPAQATTLRRLAEIWSGRRFILIGATAVGCWMNMWWRATADIDVSVAWDLDEFPRGLSAHAGWSRGQSEHRWHSPDGVKVDVLPAGDRLLESGSVVWANGAVMKLTGFRLAFEQAIPREDLVTGLVVNVPPLHVLTLLKMASYLDRPLEREHDLDDLVHVLRDGIPLDARITEETLDAQVDFHVAGAFLLGSNLRRIVDARDRDVVDTFLRQVLALDGHARTRDRMLANQQRRVHDVAEEDEDELAEELRRLWQAYARGFALPA